MSQSVRIILLALLIAIAVVGANKLWELKQNAAEIWTATGYALLVLSAVTGLIFGRQEFRNQSEGGSFLLGGLIQAFVAMILVAIFMGGGASLWTLGFWGVSAVGWVPAYIFFYALVLLLSGLIEGTRHA